MAAAPDKPTAMQRKVEDQSDMTNGQTQQVPISEAMRLAMERQHGGQLDEAELIYRAVLDAEPGHRGARYNLALLSMQRGDAASALGVLKEAADAEPGNEKLLLNYAVALAGSGDPAAAREVVLRGRERGVGGAAATELLGRLQRMIERRAAPAAPADAQHVDPPAEQWNALVRLYGGNRHEEFEQLATRLLAAHPRSVRVLHLLAASQLSRERYDDGRETLLKAHALAPEQADVLGLLGLAEYRRGRFEEARIWFDRSLLRDPRNYETLVNASANALAARDIDLARSLAEQALQWKPDGVEAMLALGNAQLSAGRAADAVQVLRRAAELSPAAADLHLNLGLALGRVGEREAAVGALRRALELRPDYAAAHLNLGRVLHDIGDSAGAQRHFLAASSLDARLTEAHSAYLFSLAHDAQITPERALAEHVRIGDLMEAPWRGRWRGHDNDRDPQRDLRIGFVSADLHDHPVANLIEPVWQAIRRGRHRIYAYAQGTAGDEVAARLRTLADQWVQIEKLSDDEVEQRIRDDRIDILFDLSGHTAGNRLLVFARKPAPIQVTWIGYPGTSGLSAIDYRFVRGVAEGREQMRRQFREQLVFFNVRGFQPAPDAPPVGPLPALARGVLTFGSFNRPSKLSAQTISLWSRVLNALGDTRLLLAGIDDQGKRDELRASFAAHGVAAARLEFRPRLPLREYLALHGEVDIALDTLPYAGGTTTMHALWMGVPVLTLAGPSIQQHLSMMTLSMTGLDDWIAGSEEDFVARARAAAADLPGLGRLRGELRSRTERHFLGVDEQAARELELAFRTMWQRWCAGEPPAGFVVGE